MTDIESGEQSDDPVGTVGGPAAGDDVVEEPVVERPNGEGYDDEGYDDDGYDGDDAGRPPSRRRWILVGAAVLVLVGLGLGLGLALSGGSSAPAGPEGVAMKNVPDLAPASTTAAGQPVDGITCRTSSQQAVKYHIHQLVSIYVNGAERRIAAGSGIAAPRQAEHLANGIFYDNSLNGCLYWLHVHTNDGVVHVESPTKTTFTLGQFFDIWQQPLGPDQVGPATGSVTAFENGKQFNGNPRDIPLLPHAVIQLDVGTPVVPFQPQQFNVSGLCGAGTNGCAAKG